jgi:hypothetical protein
MMERGDFIRRGFYMRLFCIAVAATLILPLAISVLPGEEPGRLTMPEDPEPRQELYLLQVTNTLDVPRSNEVVRYTLTLDNFELVDPSQFLVRNASSGQEVLSGHLESTVERYPSNFVHKMDIVFQDDFGPLETRTYEIDTSNTTVLTGDMTVTSNPSSIEVRDGSRRYTLYKNEVDRSGVYIAYQNGSAPAVRGYIFVRIGGNQLTIDQASVEMWWGTPTLEEIDINNVMVSVHLQYGNPRSINWGVGTMADLYKDTDVIFGDVYVNFYNDREMYETITDKKVNEKFHNHNGFVMEFTVLYAGDAEYQQIFGNSNHQVMTARTREPTWARVNPVFRTYDIGNRSAPTFGNLDNDTDLDMVVGSSEGELWFVRNTGNWITPVWSLDTGMFATFSGLANRSIPWLADVDADDDFDLILGTENGTLLEVENIGTVEVPQWSLNATAFAGIDVGNLSAPTLGDLDNDTDLDLVVGDELGFLSYYRNNGTPDSPIWQYDLLEFETFGSLGRAVVPTLQDLDADGDLDIAAGLRDGTIINIMNDGNSSSTNWTLQPTIFQGIDVGGNAVPALADLNSDGDLDIISGEYNGSLFYYQNTGSLLSPVWTQDSYVHRLSSLGVRAVPELSDLDSDGDLDLTTGVDDGTLRYFRNVGDSSLASWQEDPGFFGATDVGNYSASAFGDLDADDDLDLAIGSEEGTLVYFENTGTNTSASWTLNASMFPTIDVGSNSAPELVDIDTDGDIDLVVGNASGCVHLYRNTGTVAQPSWSYDPSVFDFMNTGLSKKPGFFATPSFSDVDGDGDLDFISGQDNAPYGSLVLYFNTGTRFAPVYDQLYPGMFNNVRGGATDGTRDYSAPEFADLTGDGRDDIVVGTNDGWLTFYRNTGNSSAQRSVNYMEPQTDGSYRFYYDQDGNDGQFVIRGTSDDFFDYYIMANPDTGRATMRYIPDFARLAYRDKYSGDQFPWAGGNVSYYPFIPEEDGYVGRGIVISRAQPGLGMGATFLTQTGTAGGFILVPLTGKSHSSREVLLPQIAHTTDYSTYDTMAQILGTPLVVTCPPDLFVDTEDITSDPPDPGEGDIITLTANVRNIGGGDASDVEVDFFDGSPTANKRIGTTQIISTIPAHGNATASVTWNLSGISGLHDVFAVVDSGNTITELDEGNNVNFRFFNITSWSRMWSPPVRMTFDANNSLEPTMVEDSNGNMWIAYHTYTKHDDWDIGVRSCKNLVCTPEDAIVTDSKRTSAPYLVADDSGNVYTIYSSNIVEWQDFINLKSGIYYWSQKFDLYSKKYNGAAWEPTVQVTASEKIDNSDQVPVGTVDGAGNLWVLMRSTHYDLYEGGYQMANMPYNDMNITAASFDGVSWTTDIIVNNDAGSQGYWGGPAATTDASGTVWTAWGAEIGNQQWDVFTTYWTGSAWAPKMQVSLSPLNDMRPSMASDSSGRIFLAWESNRTGDKEIFMRYYDGAWSPEFRVSQDPGHDIKASVVVDMRDNVWIAWESDRHGNKDIYLKRYNGSWSPPIQVTTSPHSDEEAFLAASDSTDSIWVAWESDRHGDKDIYVKTLPDVLVWPDREVGHPYNIMADMTPEYFQVNISWGLSRDDGMGEDDVVAYDIYCSPSYDRDRAGYFLLASVPAGTGYLLYELPPVPGDLFCYVESRDAASNTAWTTDQVGLLARHVVPGSNLVSIPFLLKDSSVSHVLGSTNYTYSRTYDVWGGRQWRQHSPLKTYDYAYNVDRTMGIWVNSSIDGNLLVAGVVPDETTIQLASGWNLIGFPSFREDYQIADLMADTGATRVEGFDRTAPPYYLRVLAPNEFMAAGEAYWVYVPATVSWTIGN